MYFCALSKLPRSSQQTTTDNMQRHRAFASHVSLTSQHIFQAHHPKTSRNTLAPTTKLLSRMTPLSPHSPHIPGHLYLPGQSKRSRYGQTYHRKHPKTPRIPQPGISGFSATRTIENIQRHPTFHTRLLTGMTPLSPHSQANLDALLGQRFLSGGSHVTIRP